MNKLVARSLQIIGNTAKDIIGTEYTSNLTSFINDAKNVKNAITSTATDAADTYVKLKNSNITKKISDWFYDEESKSDSGSSDDFDPGFKIDSSDDKKLDGEDRPRTLDADSMGDITEKQTNAMLKIGRRQTEQTVANTAEIVSAINSRSSEMIASMNNINKSLLGINERLDKLIQLNVIASEESKQEIDKGSLFSDGKLSLMSIFEASKQSLANNSMLSTGLMLLDNLKNGQMGPESLLKMALDMTVLNKQSNALGGKSINDIGKGFNEMIGTVTQTMMNEMINSGPFKKFFGDLSSIDQDTDYSRLVPDHYDNKKAQFDGMTRMSIVNVIPEYLSKITEHLTGISYHVDSKGRVVEGARKNKFKEVVDNTFASSGLSDTAMKHIQSASKKVNGLANKISSSDITTASKALTGVIVMDMHYQGRRLFGQKDLHGNMMPYIETAVQVLCYGKNDPEYWTQVCQTIIIQLSSGLMDSAQFIQNINQSLQNTISAATDFAQSGKPNANQATKLDMNMFAERFLRNNFESEIKQKAESTTSNTVDGKIKPVQNTPNTDRFTTHDYIRGIFGILNRGINVKTVNKPGNTRGYGDYKLTRTSTTQVKDDDKFGQIIMGMMTGGGDITDQGSIVKQAANATIEAILGKEGAAAASQAMNGGGGGFFSNMFGMMGAQGMSKMINRAFSGEMKNDVKGLFGADGKFSQLFGKAKNKAGEMTDKVFGNYKYDKRIDQSKEAIFGKDGIIDKSKEKASAKASSALEVLNQNELFTNVKNKTRHVVNNLAYSRDSIALGKAKNDMANFNADKFDNNIQNIENVEDRLLAEQAIQCIKFDDVEGARNFIGMMNDSGMKKILSKHLANYDKINEINQKRQDGEAALANGATPDIGSVLETSQVGQNGGVKDKGGIIGVVQKGFSMVGKVLKSIAKLAGEGVVNITFGLKTMASGLFGGKQRDSDGEVIRDENGKPIRTHGLIQNLTTDIIGLAGKATSGVRKKIGSKLNDIKGLTFTGEYERDAEGNIVRDDNGKKQLKNAKTVEDLLKEPGKVLAQSLKDIATNVSNSKVGQTFKDLGETLRNSKLGQAFDNLRKKANADREAKDNGEKGFLGRTGDAFRSTRFGSGFMSGFDEAKAAKKTLSEQAERMSSFPNKAVGNIMDVIMGKKNVPSALTELADIIQGIRDDMNGNHEETLQAQQELEDDKNKSSKAETDNDNNSSSIDVGDDDSGSSGSSGGKKKKKKTGGASGATAAAGSASGGGGIGGLLGNLGKIFGGFTQALLGIGQLVLSVVMSLEGFQALQDMVQSILTDGLQPLNEVFEQVMELIKPIVNILKETVSAIAETVVSIASALISVIQPLIEALTPIISMILEFIKPILEIVEVLVEVIMTPIMIIMKALQPVIEGIGYTLQIVSGILQLGLGSIVTVLGSILTAVGFIFDKLGGDDSLTQQGKAMVDQGTTMVKSGGEQIVSGIKGTIDLATRMLPGGEPLIKENTDTQQTSAVNTDNVTVNGGAMGSGDTDNRIITTNSYVYHSTYGSGNTVMNQHSYGNYMNMSERGCGPVALADAYSRRTGSRVNPATLASRMAGNGSYEPNRGTSVDSFVRTGNAMGMGMRVGGVTQASLKRATPNNPITLLGSGGDYGTRPGNNHYVNVIGTDRFGGAYVSNPLTGRVDRRSISTLALNSKLGLYGSGDADFYTFDDATNEAMQKLKDLTSRLTGMFTGDSKADKARKEIAAGEEADKAKNIKRTLDDDTYTRVEQEALNAFRADHPKRDGESDADYETRISSLWGKSENYNKYIVKYGGQLVVDSTNTMYDNVKAGVETMSTAMGNLAQGMKTLESSRSGANNVHATMGAFSPIKYVENSISGVSSAASPVHNYFNATSGSAFDDDQKLLNMLTMNGGWFGMDSAPVSKDGEGSTGNPHEGILLTYSSSDHPTIRAITGGTVTYVTRGGKHGLSDPNGGLGNSVKWRDEAGMYHWYMNLDSIAEGIEENSRIDANQIVGTMGNTGVSGKEGGTQEGKRDKNGNYSSQFLRYVVTKAGPQGSTGDNGYINPLSYWKFEQTGVLVGDTELEQIYNYLISTLGMTEKSAAGVMGVFANEGMNHAPQLEGIFGNDRDERSAKYGASFDTLDEFSRNILFPGYAANGVSISKAGYESEGKYLPGLGLAQWTGPRARQLMNYAASKGTKWSDLKTQIDFTAIEKDSKFQGLFELLSKNDTSVQTAADAWMTQYEAGGTGVNPHTTWLSGSQIEARRKSAQELYSQLHDKVIPASTSLDDGPIMGRFISTMSNLHGNVDSLYGAIAQVFEAASENGGVYGNYDVGPVTLRDGTVLENFRQDCSGLISAAIRSMGYDFSTGDNTGIRTYDLYQRDRQDLVTRNGKVSDDWMILPYEKGILQPGDIVTTSEHMGMYVSGSDSGSWGNRGFDGGSSDGIRNSGNAGAAYLDGEINWEERLHSTIGGPDGVTRILRYLGSKNKPNGSTAGEVHGGFSGASYYGYTGNTTQIGRENIIGPVGLPSAKPSVNNGTGPSKPQSGPTQLQSNKSNNITSIMGPTPFGSGDVGNFWYDSLFNTDIVQTDIPDLDESKFQSEYNNGAYPYQTIVNKYDIKSDDAGREKFLKSMSCMTFNVRAQRVEELLEELIEKIDGNKPKPSTPQTTPSNLFTNNQIPSQVVRLSRG